MALGFATIARNAEAAIRFTAEALTLWDNAWDAAVQGMSDSDLEFLSRSWNAVAIRFEPRDDGPVREHASGEQ